MTSIQLEERLIEFGVKCSLLTRKFPSEQYYDAKNVTHQLIRAATSPGFHYGETRAAESKRDFLHKLKMNLKELREARNELRYAQKMKYVSVADILPVYKGSEELIRIFMATVKSVQKKMK